MQRTRWALICAAAAIVAGCGSSQGRRISLPPASASPPRVVRAYIAAINAHDRGAARALLTPSWYRTVTGEADSWLNGGVTITHLRTNKPSNDSSDAKQLHERFCVVVGTSFDLHQTHPMSMSNGPNVWAYFLCRKSVHGRWRIADEGLG